LMGECIVCKTDFGVVEWSLNEIFWAGEVKTTRQFEIIRQHVG
jgi:hypothetical protein